MGVRRRPQHPWRARARRRVGLLAVTTAVVAFAAATAVLVLVIGPAAARDRSAAITDPATARAAVGVAVALDGLAVAVLGVLALVALVVVATRLDLVRSAEDALLTARGATRGQLARWGAAEGIVTAAVGSAVGTAVAVAVSLPTGPSTGSISSVVTATVCAAVLVGTIVPAAVVGRRRRSTTGIVGQVVAAGVLVAAAVFATWRLFTAGVPIDVVRRTVTVDVVAAAAPVVWIVAGASVVVLLGSVAARVVARSATGWRGLLPALTARRTARTWASSAPGVLVVSIVAATGVFVAGFAATVAEVDDDTARAVVGPDVRVRLDGDAVVGERSPLQRIRLHRPASGSITPVWTDTVGVGSVDVPIVATSAARAAALLPGTGADRLGPAHRSGVPLVPGRRSVSIDVRTTVATFDDVQRPDAVGSVRFAAWVVDDDGVPALVTLTSSADGTGAVAVGGAARLTGTLPSSGSGWRLLAVEPTLTFASRPADTDSTFTSSRLRVAVGATVDGAAGPVSGETTAVDLAPPARIVLGRSPGNGRLPVVLTSTLADRLGVRIGSHLDVTPASTGSPVASTVRAIVASVPGTGSRSAVVTDLSTLVATTIDGGAAPAGSAVPRVGERWITTSDPTSVVESLRTGLSRGSTVTSGAAVRSGPVVATAVAGLATTAALGALLVLLVLAIVGAEPDPARRVLRALGVPARRSAAARGLGSSLPAVLGVLGGTAAGILAVGTTVAPFAVAAVPAARGLVDAAPVAVTPAAFVAPVVLLVVTAVVATVVVVRGRRTEGDS
ncbi:hypothetical protein ACIPJ2_00190 [Curtobacterium sp. NPDC090217]|uniref:hypothetical protein n=1 Tax=Curtobacterium sp. NPDC090217 TaxID=3363970 RepID=UPI0037F4CCF3